MTGNSYSIIDEQRLLEIVKDAIDRRPYDERTRREIRGLENVIARDIAHAFHVPTAEEFERILETARAEEREKCAEIAELSLDVPQVTGEARYYIAARIRARKEK